MPNLSSRALSLLCVSSLFLSCHPTAPPISSPTKPAVSHLIKSARSESHVFLGSAKNVTNLGPFSEGFRVQAGESCAGTASYNLHEIAPGCVATWELYENGSLINVVGGITSPGSWSYPVGCSCGPITIESYQVISGASCPFTGRTLLTSISGTIDCGPSPSPTPTPPPSGGESCDPQKVAEIQQALQTLRQIEQQAGTAQSTGSLTAHEADGFTTQNALSLLARLAIAVGTAVVAAENTKAALEIKEPVQRAELAQKNQRLSEIESEKEALVQERQSLGRDSSLSRDEKRQRVGEITQAINALNDELRPLQQETRALEKAYEETLTGLGKLAPLGTQLSDLERWLLRCMTPAPVPREKPCPSGLDMDQMVNDYDARAQQARVDFVIPDDKTVALADVNQNGAHQSHVAHSGETSKDGTVQTPEESGQSRIFSQPPINSKGKPLSYSDAERKIAEHLAHENQNAANPSGRTTLYSDRATCLRCQPLANEFRDMFPNMELLWFDKSGKCY